MNDTLLLVGHGSRRPGSNDEIEAFVQLWRQRHPDWRIELCFIELAETLLDAGLDRAATHGRRVMVLPLHPHLVGVPHRITWFNRILEILAARDDVVFMTGSEIADWYQAAEPAPEITD